MNMKLLLILMGCFLLVPLLHAEGTSSRLQGLSDRVYKWVGDDGKTQYTQYPPDNRKYEEVERTYSSADSDEQAADESSAPVGDAGENGTAPKSGTEGGGADELTKRNCVTAQNNLVLLEAPQVGITYMDAEGNTIEVDAKERAARIKAATKQVAEFCK